MHAATGSPLPSTHCPPLAPLLEVSLRPPAVSQPTGFTSFGSSTVLCTLYGNATAGPFASRGIVNFHFSVTGPWWPPLCASTWVVLFCQPWSPALISAYSKVTRRGRAREQGKSVTMILRTAPTDEPRLRTSQTPLEAASTANVLQLNAST
ncbi:hypothetical protein CH063_04577 [Colletotrichum higginsianum]|uniref:Uncharacterized protein n=1 Tax=Colletotrichum higginsianum (strain IMI 349063) TaxID=759273 RepID=H1UVY2_COLHI|nr:hypothetical protein CH063_04577 [Colletotrichum higginsianum]